MIRTRPVAAFGILMVLYFWAADPAHADNASWESHNNAGKSALSKARYSDAEKFFFHST